MEEFAVVAASLCIGLSLGFIGAGGSILTVPVFIYILKKDPLSSGVYSMFVVGVSAVAGSIRSLVKKLVDFNALLAFGIPSITGAVISRKVIFPSIPAELFSIGTFVLSKEVLFIMLLATLMIASSLRMLKPVMNHQNGDVNKNAGPTLLITGLVIGMITGLAGIGGGFLIVPALVIQAGLPVKKAINTGFLIIAANSFISFISSFTMLDIDWSLLCRISLGAITGILVGSRLSAKITGTTLKRIFAWVVLGIAAFMLYKLFFI